MAIYPGATLRLLPENETQPRIRPTQVILHTAVDAPGPTRLDRYFARVDVRLESHFWIPLSGEVVQMMDTEVRADANRFANLRPDGTGAISIETEDEGNPEGVPWTEAQVRSIIKIIRWAHQTHGIPLTECPNPSGPGVGYHSMWGSPSSWTPSVGKTCPGKTRIRQYYGEVLPALTKEAAVMALSNSESKRLSEALYEAFLLRSPDSEGWAYWTSVGESKGALRMFTSFLVGAKTEIRLAREAAQKEAAEVSRLYAGLRADVTSLSAQVAALRADIDSLRASLDAIHATPAPPAPEVDLDAIADAVVERIINRLS